MVLHGLQFAQEMSFWRIILESDPKTINLKLQSNVEDYSALRPITWDVKALLKRFKFCCFKFAPRGCNTAMHATATLGWKGSIDRFWVEYVPSEVWEVVAKD